MPQAKGNDYIVFMQENSVEFPKGSASFARGHKNGRREVRGKLRI